MNTRNFREELSEFMDMNVTSERLNAFVDKIHKTLIDENNSIITIDTYFLMNNIEVRRFSVHGFCLYFVITESIWKDTPQRPNKIHMVMPIFDNPEFTANFLDEPERLDEASLKSNFAKHYIHPIIEANI